MLQGYGGSEGRAGMVGSRVEAVTIGRPPTTADVIACYTMPAKSVSQSSQQNQQTTTAPIAQCNSPDGPSRDVRAVHLHALLGALDVRELDVAEPAGLAGLLVSRDTH